MTKTVKYRKRKLVCQICLTTVFILSSILWSYYLYKPLPDGISNPWKVRAIVSLFKIAEDLANLGQKLGLASKPELVRSISHALSLLVSHSSPGLKVYDTVFDGIPVRIYDPIKKEENGPAIVFYHGGGWIFCSVDVHDHLTRSIAQSLNIVLVSVEYRLAPEHPYPAALVDCSKATRHFLQHSKDWSVNPSRVAVMGDSAGGNLAAAVSLDLKMTSDLQPALQVLIYPVLQGFDLSLPSFLQNDDAVYGSRISMAEVLLYYMGQDLSLARHLVSNNHTNAELRDEFSQLVDIDFLPEHFRLSNGSLQDDPHESIGFVPHETTEKLRRFILDPLFAPLMSENLEGLPPAYIITAQHDVLRDDGALYAERLRRSGVKVKWAHYHDAFHGFWAFFDPPIQLDVARRSMDELAFFLKNNL